MTAMLTATKRFIQSVYHRRFLGRQFRPIELGLMMTTGGLALAVRETLPPIGWDEEFGEVGVIVFSGMVVLLLFIGWLENQRAMMEWGLLLCAGVWAARATYILTAQEPLFATVLASALLDLGLAVIAAGTYLASRAEGLGE